MPRHPALVPIALSILLFLAGCQPVPAPPVPIAEADPLADMTLVQKVSSLFMIPLPDDATLSDEAVKNRIQRDVLDFGAGGVVVMRGTALDVAPVIAWLQGRQERAGVLPVLVAVDAEWGTGMRFPDMPVYPRAMGLAASGDPRLARDVGYRTALAARSIGIGVVFAPVADVNTETLNPVIGTRAFSDDGDTVATWVAAWADGVREAGVMAVAKHFPGHGGTTADSHVDLPDADLQDHDLVPFRRLISDGVGGIMSAHVRYDSTGPATLSRPIMTGLLRDSLGFRGLAFSDALNMAGVARDADPGTVAIEALQAGIDMLLMSTDPYAARAAVVRAVRDGSLAEDRIDEAARRILAARAAHPISGDLEHMTQLQESEQAFSVYAARRTLTLLRDRSALLPLTDPDERILFVATDTRDGGPAATAATRLADAVRAHVRAETDVLALSASGWNAALNRARSAIGGAETVIWVDMTGTTSVSGWDPTAFSDALAAQHDRVIALSLGSPWSADAIHDAVGTLLVAYDALPPTIEALARALTGRTALSGRLPVTVSTDYPAGSGTDRVQVAPAPGPPEEGGMTRSSLDAMDRVIHAAMADSAFPAATLVVGRGHVLVKREAYGRPTYTSDRDVTTRDLFDLASLTKVIATTTMVMLLVEDGVLELDRPVADYLPEFAQNGKGLVTIRDLLAHSGGLIPFRAFYADGVRSADEVRRRILSDSLLYAPGTDTRYSDFGPITLAWVMESVTGRPFRELVQERIFEPLGMVDTGYRDARRQRADGVIPTEVDKVFRGRLLTGEVHDENAWLLGGTAGHAGLFSTVEDLAIFADMLVHEGRVGTRQFLKPETIERFTTAVAPNGPSTRALGWDTRSRMGYSSAGAHFGPRAFGHTGFTGTSFWVDPDQDLYVILLTNRVHPTRANSGHVPVRPAVANGAFQALDDLPRDVVLEPRE